MALTSSSASSPLLSLGSGCRRRPGSAGVGEAARRRAEGQLRNKTRETSLGHKNENSYRALWLFTISPCANNGHLILASANMNCSVAIQNYSSHSLSASTELHASAVLCKLIQETNIETKLNLLLFLHTSTIDRSHHKHTLWSYPLDIIQYWVGWWSPKKVRRLSGAISSSRNEPAPTVEESGPLSRRHRPSCAIQRHHARAREAARSGVAHY